MKKLYSLVIGLLVLGAVARGQACYEIVQIPFYASPLTSGNEVDFPSMSNDRYSEPVSIGFDFCFFGVYYNEVVVSSNGFISFDTSLANAISPSILDAAIPSTGSPRNSVLAAWKDLFLSWNVFSGDQSQIRSQISGSSPYRRFIVNFNGMAPMDCSSPENFSGQIVLYETLNVIDIRTTSNAPCPDTTIGAGIQGILNLDGTEAYSVPGRNYPEQWASNGDTYRFIPQCGCAAPEPLLMGNVQGRVFYDYDQDCSHDAGEPGIANMRLDVEPDNGIIWTGQQGLFSFNAQLGNHTLQFSPSNPWYHSNICPSGPVSVTVVENETVGPLFWGDTIVPVNELSVTIGSTALQTCFLAQQQVSVCNNGNIPSNNVLLKVLLPSALMNVQSGYAFTYIGDTLRWNVGRMDPGECRTILITDSVACSPSLVNQSLCLLAWVGVDSTDVEPENNSDQSCYTVTGSYDPNDKQVRIAGMADVAYAPAHDIAADHRLEYLIRFQNTGTAAAYNITIVDTIDAALDPQTITPGASSHFYTAQLQGTVLTFHFPAILLPDSASDPLGSKGWVHFTISQMPGNTMGTTIPNAAAIYFDNNEPVVTASSYSSITGLVGLDDSDRAVNIVPNPTSTSFRVLATDFSDVTIEVLDISGRIVLTHRNYTGQPIDVSVLPQGIYPVRVSSPAGISTAKLVRN